MSSVDDGHSIEALERTKRRLLRSLAALKGQIDSAFTQNAADDLAQKIGALLEEARTSLRKLEDITDQILDATDVTDKTPEQVAKLEEKIGADHIKYQLSFANARGKLNSLFNHLKSSKPSTRQSLDTSFICDGAPSNPLVKLPDIPVPKFDGKIKNFTEWHSLFSAMIDANDKLKPVQKLYYLKQAMTGDAENLLKDYALQEGLYDAAFKYVKERYFNKRVIISNHFRDILDLPAISLSSLRESLDQISASMRGLKVCDINTAQMSPFITYIVARKLPEKLRADWENSNLDYSTYPSYNLLENFLQNRCFSYESIRSETTHTPASPKSNDKEKLKPKSKTSSLAMTVSNPNPFPRKCLLCDKEHFLSQCDDFIQKSVADRFAFVKDKRLCTNCLRKGHSAVECNSSQCRKCSKKHNTLLHREISRSSSPVAKATNVPVLEEKKTSLAIVSRKNCIILLPSAVVNVQLGSFYVKTRVLIDACSQANLVAEKFVLQHRLQARTSRTTIAGVNPSDLHSSSSVSLRLKSRTSEFSLELEANVVGRIPYEVTSNTIKRVESIALDLPLGDCHLRSPAVDILIGGEFANKLLSGNKKTIDDLVLEETPLGWVAAGPLSQYAHPDNRCCHLTVKVEDTLAKFWEVEEVDSTKPNLSEHEMCEMHFNSTHSRLTDGRFQIRLPFKQPTTRLADTYRQARSALIRSESKLDPSTRSLYVDFMREYQQLGHMVPVADTREARFFIPHLPVLRPASSTTKLRVVFNASAKNSTGHSLNESLMVGPMIQPDSFDLLLSFRRHRIAFSADVTKMYRQIVVHPEDRCFQSILWRDSPEDPIRVFELTTLTYGTTPASFVATRCLQVLAQETEQVHPEVAHAIAHEFYMDDLLTGADSVQDAIGKCNAIHSTLARAHFPLRKYVSNSPEFLHALDPSLVEPLKPIEFSASGAASVLGLQWNPKNDCFLLNVKLLDIENTTLTKRAVSSLAAQIFDPLGLAAPVIIRAKILLQDLWREELSWDEPISNELDQKFRSYYAELRTLPMFHVPRFYSATEFQLVGFADASLRAYGAAVYLRTANEFSTLVCAKSKVAPLKLLTIPRLELLGAVLLTKLLSRVCTVLKCDVTTVTAFCDSTIVLAWLKGPSSKFQPFVRNRVEFVSSLLPFEQWQYVSSAENPADLLTRGIAVKNLIDNSLWTKGPSWLRNSSIRPIRVALPEELPETRKVCNVLTSVSICDESFIARYSNFDKLIKIASIIWQFVRQVNSRFLKYDALPVHTRGLFIICHVSQTVFFRSEIQALETGNLIPSKSPLAALNPFIDAHGLLRVGGRLSNSHLSYDTRHPIILSRHSILSELLIRHMHEKYFHAYRSFTLAFLQSRFWIVSGAAQLVKKVLRACIFCARLRGESPTQLMGDLPRERITIARPFSYTGVDFAGPFTIRCTNHRTLKHLKYYAAFFICFSTRAVHLEHVSNLSTDAFIAALQRFAARRGIPHTIWSDNATNFVGAKNVLENHCTSLGITWRFIPARSPHFGGLWESAVKAGKKHVVAAAKNQVLTAEQFATILTVVESILNSRPLYRKREVADPDAIDALTPGHFLVGSHLLQAAPVETHAVSLNDRLEIQHRIIRSFWQLWRKSYLAQLQSRSKWRSPSDNLAVGDIVLMKEDSSLPLQWDLARVTNVHPDSKGLVRVVDVSHGGSTYTRSIQKVVRLPVD